MSTDGKSSKKAVNKTARREKRRKWFKAYAETRKSEINKRKKLEKHLKKHPNDLQSKERMQGVYPSKKPIPDIKRPLNWFYKIWIQ